MNLPDFLTRGQEGEIYLTGHRVDLYLIVLFYKEGHTALMLHEALPSLPVALIKQAIDFYVDNKADVDAYLAEIDTKIERLRAEHQPGPELLRIRKLMEERARTGEHFSGTCRE
jgi:uncharacterized protein (DUF433 family)